ncbi:MAG: hypothetical protein RLZZ385_1370 [Pseudomonadota bacterium]|jgi:hypothetical protein
MGQVIQFSQYQGLDAVAASQQRNTLVPIEFAVGDSDRDYCMTQLARFGVTTLHLKLVGHDPEVLLYLMPIGDAIRFNKLLLDKESLCEFELGRRIDLIQMLENINTNLMDSIWDSLSASKA